MKTLLILIAVFAIAGAALAAEKPRETSPMMQEITDALETARLEVADLKLRYDAAGDQEEAMAIRQEMIRIKTESRIEMMRIQLRYARQRGDDELVAELEEIVTRMTAPPAKGVPVPRREHE